MTLDWEGGTLEESGKLEEPDYRCPHGVYTGDPYGPDFMCGFCEDGTSDEEYRAYHVYLDMESRLSWAACALSDRRKEVGGFNTWQGTVLMDTLMQVLHAQRRFEGKTNSFYEKEIFLDELA